MSMYQSKYATIMGGTLSPGPELPPSFNPAMVGAHGLAIGVAEFIGGLLTGRLGDKIGRRGCVRCPWGVW